MTHVFDLVRMQLLASHDDDDDAGLDQLIAHFEQDVDRFTPYT